MQQSCTCGSVRGASGQLASLPRPRIPAALGILDATIWEFFTCPISVNQASGATSLPLVVRTPAIPIVVDIRQQED